MLHISIAPLLRVFLHCIKIKHIISAEFNYEKIGIGACRNKDDGWELASFNNLPDLSLTECKEKCSADEEYAAFEHGEEENCWGFKSRNLDFKSVIEINSNAACYKKLGKLRRLF